MNGNKWKRTTLEPLIKIRSGDSPSLHTLSRTEGVPFVKVEDLNNCRKYQVTSREFITSKVSPIPEGSVIFPKRGAAILNNKIRLTAAPMCLDTNMMALTVTSDELHADFLFYTLSHARLHAIADTSTIPQLNNKHINPFVILLPSISEQKQIATILSTWDRAIELNARLIAAKQQRKDALLQTLFTGKVRLPRFAKGHWSACQLGDIASNSTRRNGTTKSPQVYSVTNSVGMVPMSVDVIGESINRYKTVGKHDFAYNPMRLNVGSIAMWNGDVDVLVSPDYVVFQCGDELDAEFLNHFRMTHFWHQFVNRSGGGSVRVRIYFSDLAEMPLKLPPLDEQKAIAAVLNTQDWEIELLRKKLDALRRQKKGLMQQLLTGKVRVNVTGASGE